MIDSLSFSTMAAALTGPFLYVAWGVAIIIGFACFMFVLRFGALWIQAWASGVALSPFSLLGMWFRKINPTVVVNTIIMGAKAGNKIEIDKLEAHYLAGGNVVNVVTALIAAGKAGIDLDFDMAAGIDLAGRDVLEAVQTSVNPKVIDAPNPEAGNTKIAAVAMDGIQLRAKARVTVRANLERLIGGAKEETIVARVCEGIVTTIGSASSHKLVLENPDMISKKVLEKGLDSGTAFEILSIDIADIDVAENIGAALQQDQAEADKNVAQAKAEERRAMAVAAEQEMLAKVQENRAKVVEAEAQVPLAIAEAFRNGNLGVMDYYRMQNIESDTSMRSAIAHDSEEDNNKEIE